jgi:hypothetical protein
VVDFVVQVLQQWELSEYERCASLLEAAIASAAQDALSEIRSIARSLFASFRLSLPLRANVLLSNMDFKTREKLQFGAPSVLQGKRVQAVAQHRGNYKLIKPQNILLLFVDDGCCMSAQFSPKRGQ